MKIMAEEKQELMEEGSHTGTIVKVEYRTEPYAYTDIFIQPEGKEFTLKYGCPTKITPDTKLGKLLMWFTPVMAGQEYDPEEVLIGKKVKFLTRIEKTTEGEFVRVITDTVKPLK